MNNRKLGNGKVWTGNNFHKWAELLFIENGEIKFVGFYADAKIFAEE